METKEIKCTKTIEIPDGKRLKDIEITVTPVFENILENGDVFYATTYSGEQKFIGVYNNTEKDGILNFGNGWEFVDSIKQFGWDTNTERKATEKEIKIFREILNHHGSDYDLDTKSIVHYEWKPNYGNIYYYIDFNISEGKFCINSHMWCDDSEDNKLYNSKFGIFKCRFECDIKCHELNEKLCQE